MSTTVAARPVVRAAQQVLRPFHAPSWQPVTLGWLGAIVPGFVVITLLAIESGRLLPAIGIGALLAAHAAAAVLLFRSTKIVLDRDGLVFTGISLRPVRIARGRIRKAVVRRIATSDGLGATEDLFLLDAEGTAVFRRSDRWWRKEDLSAVAMHFQVPIQTVPEVLSRADLRRLPARELRWHERAPFVASLLAAAVVIADCATAAALAITVLG